MIKLESLTRSRRNVGILEINSVLNRQNGLCPYCGMPVDIKQKRGRHWTLDHVLPYAVFKWLENVLNDEQADELWKAINSNENLVIAHNKCNLDKNSAVHSEHQIQAFILPDDVKEAFIKLHKDMLVYTTMYKEMIYDVARKYNYKCYRCGTKKHSCDLSLRRLDSNKIRSKSNACIVCKDCNAYVSRSHYINNGKILGRYN